MWSDPEEHLDTWAISPRGAGWMFGAEVTTEFLFLNNLKAMVRAHQVCHEGYMMHHNDQCITVWSAPNYCYRVGNLAVVMQVNPNMKYDFKIFESGEANENSVHWNSVLPYFL